MLIHEFGNKNQKVIVMIHGLSMSWNMMDAAIDLLKEQYHVLAIAVPGMDMDENNEFTSIEEIASDIEDALFQKGISYVHCIYGLSMGGAFVLKMLANNKVYFENAIMDGGITPYELPYLTTRLILVNDVCMTLLGKASKKLLAYAFPAEDYSRKTLDQMYSVLKHMSFSTIVKAYDSTDNYTMPHIFPLIDTNIQYWYGEAEKKARKLDIQYVQRHVPNIHFREISNMKHGQYVIAHPEEFFNDIKNIIEGAEKIYVSQNEKI